MISRKEARELGMDRTITRRDFLNGAAVATAGTWVGLKGERAFGQQAAPPPEGYPPVLTGIRGQQPSAVEEGHRVRDGAYLEFPKIEVDTGELYDLVVVGGGFSGMAAAHYFRDALGEKKTVLILDNLDDIGGHARRNEFHHEGRLFIGCGGTAGISTPYPYSYAAKALIRDIGIQMERAQGYSDEKIYDSRGLTSGLYFDKETFGEDRLVTGYGSLPLEEFLARTPLSEEVKRDLVRLETTKEDFLPGLSAEEKRARLTKMSYQDYLVKVVRVAPDALPFTRAPYLRNDNQMDTTPALHAAHRGAPGFAGLGLDLEHDYARQAEREYSFHPPDGGATVARLLVKKLVPASFPGDQDMETIQLAKLNYARLDEASAPVRIRLNSTVVRVQHEGTPHPVHFAELGHASPGTVRLAYVKDGKIHGVRARNCILACFNSIVRFLVPELPEVQKQALAYPVKVPIVYTNLFIRNWKAFEKLGVSNISAPTAPMYYTGVRLSSPVSIGGYRCSQTPEVPVICRLSHSYKKPGLSRREQNLAGMRELLATPFEQMELEARRSLARLLGPGGFDPAEDILALTVNRWPHGYAYTYDSFADPDVPEEQRPHVLGRQPFGLIAIANSDAGGAAFINEAFDQAQRAVHELLHRHGLT